MNGMLNAANRNFRSIGGNFSNFHSSASPVNRVSAEIYSQQAVNMPYTLHGATIRIDFRYRGVRCRETLKGLRVTKANIKFAEKKRAAILHEIGREIFDYSKHFPESPRCRLFGTNPHRDRTVDQALDPQPRRAQQRMKCSR